MAALTADETTFLRRALPHFMAGKSVEDAMRAVVDDDARILNACISHRGQQYFGDFLPASTIDSNPVGTSIQGMIANGIYRALRNQPA